MTAISNLIHFCARSDLVEDNLVEELETEIKRCFGPLKTLCDVLIGDGHLKILSDDFTVFTMRVFAFGTITLNIEYLQKSFEIENFSFSVSYLT